MLTLDRAFFCQSAPIVAKSLLGKLLIHRTQQGPISGRIVETDAYLGAEDAASHAFAGQTRRNAVMFGAAGHAYIYFTYGIHYCFNVVTGQPGEAEAVLIRALEPLAGTEEMQRQRRTTNLLQLCSGPAKLVQALAISPQMNGHDLTSGQQLYFQDGDPPLEPIISAPRVGISLARELPLRFYLQGNPHVSRPR